MLENNKFLLNYYLILLLIFIARRVNNVYQVISNEFKIFKRLFDFANLNKKKIFCISKNF